MSITAAKRHSIPLKKFGLPEQEKYPLDTAKRVKAAATYSAKEHNRGNLSDAQFSKIQHHIQEVKPKFGIGGEHPKPIAHGHAHAASTHAAHTSSGASTMAQHHEASINHSHAAVAHRNAGNEDKAKEHDEAAEHHKGMMVALKAKGVLR